MAALGADEAGALRKAGRVESYEAGTRLFEAGDTSDFVLVIQSGQVKASLYAVDGQEVVLGVRGPGELSGELSAIDRQPRSATVQAIEPVEALVVSSEAFMDFLRHHPRLPIMLLRDVSGRLRDADHKRIEYGATAGWED